jgi:hypothetical protein
MVTPADDLITDSGAENPNTPAEWDGWVSPSNMRNYVLGVPVCDWLNRMQDRVDPSDPNWKGDARTESGYDIDLDATKALFKLGNDFEDQVWNYLQPRFDCVQIATYTEVSQLSKAVETLDAMRAQREIIYQGVLRDPVTRIFGMPDLLVRADVLPRITALSGSTVVRSSISGDLYEHAPELRDSADLPDEPESGWHYRIVDVKASTVELSNRNGTLNGKKEYKTQLAAYTHGLTRMQGFAPPEAYILARGWKQGTDSGDNCFDVLAPVPTANFLNEAIAAADWIREMRTSGFSGLGLGPHTPLWNADTPTPSHPNLRIDKGKSNDCGYWRTAADSLARQQNELTLLPGIRAAPRDNLLTGPPPLTNGWRDSNFALPTPSNLLQKVVYDANTLSSPGILPARGATPAPTYPPSFRTPVCDLEFFVDYEAIQSGAREKFSNFPNKLGDAELIYMIGCGHSINRVWSGFECFVVTDLTQPAEEAIFRQWFNHMRSVSNGQEIASSTPQIIHWDDYERNRNNSAMLRAGDPAWWYPSRPTTKQIADGTPVPANALNLWDIKTDLMNTVPFGVTGAFGWGVKPIAKAMARIPAAAGQIGLWPPSPIEHGLAASMAPLPAWRARTIPLNTRNPADTTKFADQLIEDSRAYNEVDCKIMFDILEYLRSNH